jgi:hypothetical protein
MSLFEYFDDVSVKETMKSQTQLKSQQINAESLARIILKLVLCYGE